MQKELNTWKNKYSWRDIIYDMGIVIIGAILFGMSMNMFLIPGHIILGGLTGIATALNIFFKTPIGLVTILLNIPLIIINTKYFGIKFFTKIIIGIFATSLAVDFLKVFPITIEDPLLCAVFGGATMGFGTGLLFTRGYTTGGTDLAVWLLKLKFKNISTGKLIMILDFIIIVGATIFTKNYEGIFYSVITIYAFTKIVDLVLSGADKAKLTFIISPKYQLISDSIFKYLKRGVTILYGHGAYTKKDKCILMCVVKKAEIFKIKTIIHGIDPEAFIIFSDATEVMGSGFKANS